MIRSIWAAEPIAMRKLLIERAQEWSAIAGRELPDVQVPTAGPAADGARGGLPMQVVEDVAVVRVAGLLQRRPTRASRVFGDTAMVEAEAALRLAAADDAIKSIMLLLDTPGGTVDGLEELAAAIRDVKADKPIIAQVEGMAASAGFWIASQASEIVAGPNNLVGSIGVRLMLFDVSEAFQNAGIRPVLIDTGEFKSTGAIGTEITAEQEADLRRIVDQFFGEFVKAVSKGRGLSKADTLALADGRVFTAKEAKANGLIDRIGTTMQTLGRISRSSRTRAARRSVANAEKRWAETMGEKKD